jgi:ABC-2 type transport system permease protein
MSMVVRPFAAVLEREILKLLRQRGRLVSAMVRPLLWLLVIGAGFGAVHATQGKGSYQAFLVPGVLGMTLLFGGMLAALATVYDKESGVMRMLIIAPIKPFWIVLAKTLGATVSALIQALLLLVILAVLGYLSGQMSIMLLALALLCTAVACSSLGMLVAAWTPSLDNYATMMNFVIFPVFFLSGALYPVQQLPQVLRIVATLNPFTYGIDLLKHAAIAGSAVSYGVDFSITLDFAVLVGFSVLALAIAGERFSRDTANEPLVHQLASNKRA